MVRLSWRIYTVLILIGLSIMLGVSHFLIFKDSKDLFFYLALDIVFVPIQVLLVTIIIERLLAEREKQALLHKLNMVIGAFFGEVGTRLLRDVNVFIMDSSELASHLGINDQWAGREFKDALNFIEDAKFRVEPSLGHLQAIREFLLSQRGFLLTLLENSNLLEHERFTDLLWAVSHLTEELEARTDFNSLPTPDLAHIQNDIRRAFGLLIREWLHYMQHLKSAYPYIYSLAVRTNPFNPSASPIIKNKPQQTL